MERFPVHTLDSAPTESQPLLDGSLKSFGMIPNLHGVMAEAPALLEGYQQLHSLFQQTSFSAEELTVVWQSLNVEHSCHYCVPAHTAIAHQMKVDASIIDALKTGDPLPPKLEALRTFALAMARQRGNVTEADIQSFIDAGYQPQQMLEVVLGLAQKVMSNYVNHFAHTPLDKPFQKFA